MLAPHSLEQSTCIRKGHDAIDVFTVKQRLAECVDLFFLGTQFVLRLQMWCYSQNASSEKDDLQAFKTLLKIHDLVEEDATADDAEKPKPEPDIFQAALNLLAVDPVEALALGDTPWDIEAAGKAGVSTVAVQSGGWSREQLQEAGAIAVYVDVADIVRNFEQSPFAG